MKMGNNDDISNTLAQNIIEKLFYIDPRNESIHRSNMGAQKRQHRENRYVRTSLTPPSQGRRKLMV